ncbi:MAG: hypothetical protein HQL52_11855 [Magnetococcales bacterium]|nr:hypothetical protein [Magnetococcales bacterium]
MADSGSGGSGGQSVEAAINQVLAAEESARESVARCGEESARLLLIAREEARRIEERLDKRISRLRKRRNKKINNRIDHMLLDNQRAMGHKVRPSAADQPLAEAVAILADQLTGGESA